MCLLFHRQLPMNTTSIKYATWKLEKRGWAISTSYANDILIFSTKGLPTSPIPSPLLPKQKSAAATLWWTEKNIIRRDESRNKNKQSESDIGANPGLVPIHQVGIRACMILIWFAALFEEILIQEINNYQLNLGVGDSFVNPLSLGFEN